MHARAPGPERLQAAIDQVVARLQRKRAIQAGVEPAATWSANRSTGEDLLNHARRRVPHPGSGARRRTHDRPISMPAAARCAPAGGLGGHPQPVGVFESGVAGHAGRLRGNVRDGSPRLRGNVQVVGELDCHVLGYLQGW